MKKIYNALVLGVTLMLLSCYNNEGIELPINENIIIDLSASVTRAEDTSTESYVNHIDIFVFEDEAGAPAALAHYERQQLNNSRTLTLNANRSSFAADEAYYVYLVANSNIAEATFSTLADYNALLNTKQEDPMVYLSGLDDENFPKYFLMDAVAMNAASEKAIEINGPVVIDTYIYKDEFVLPMLPPGGSVDDIITEIND